MTQTPINETHIKKFQDQNSELLKKIIFILTYDEISLSPSYTL